MLTYIASRLIQNKPDAEARISVGLLCGCTGIALNLLLFAVKLFAGTVTGSVAVRADAFHNLTDCFSSAVTAAGFLALKKSPKNKINIENIAGFTVGLVLIITGGGLLRESVLKIFSPDGLCFSPTGLVILLLSVAVKIYMARYNFSFGKKINSAALKAAGTDCLCDCFSTAVSIVSLILSGFASFNADAYGGAAVSLIMLFAGGKTAVVNAKILKNDCKNKDDLSKDKKIAEK